MGCYYTPHRQLQATVHLHNLNYSKRYGSKHFPKPKREMRKEFVDNVPNMKLELLLTI